MRVLGFLRCGGDGVEADIGKEYVRGTSADSAEARGRECGPIVPPVCGVDVAHPEQDDEEHDADLDDDDGGVETGALLDSDHQDGGNDQSDHERRKIKADFHAEKSGRRHQIVSALEQLRRLRGDNLTHAREKGLRGDAERRIGSMGHLPGDDIFRGDQRGPVVVGQPQRHLQVKISAEIR